MPAEELNQAVTLIKSGQKELARVILTQLIQAEPHNVAAWLWLAEIMEDDTRRIGVLEACLKLNPQSQMAQRGLERLRERQAPLSTSSIETSPTEPLPTPAPSVPKTSPILQRIRATQEKKTQEDCQPHEPTEEPPTQPLPVDFQAAEDIDTFRQVLEGKSKSHKLESGDTPELVKVHVLDQHNARAPDQEENIASWNPHLQQKPDAIRKSAAGRRRQRLSRWLILIVLGLSAALAVSSTAYIMRDQLSFWLGLSGGTKTPIPDFDLQLTLTAVNQATEATPTQQLPTSTITPTPTITPIPTPTATVVHAFSYAVIGPENAAQVVQVGELASIPALSVAISSDNRLLAAGMKDATVYVWFMAEGSIEYIFQGHTMPVHSVAFSPDNRYLISGSEDRTVRIWDLISGEEAGTLIGHAGEVKSVAFSPDGRTFASGGVDGNLILWQVGASTAIQTLSVGVPVISLDFTSDGRYLASGLQTGEIEIWDVATKGVLRTLSGHNSSVNSLKFAPNGHRLATGSDDMTVKLWDVDSGKILYTIGTHTDAVQSVAFSPDGRVLASASLGQTIKLWDVALRRELAILRHARNMPALAFSPDGRVFASALSPTNPESDEGGVAIWGILFNPETTPALEQLTINAFQNIVWTPGARMAMPHVAHEAVPILGGRVLIISGGVLGDPASFTNKVELYNPNSGSSLFTGGLNVSRGSFSATLLRDGRVLVVGGINASMQEETSAEIYDPISGNWSLTYPLTNHGTGHTATLLNDGRVLVIGGCVGGEAGGTNQQVELFDPGTNNWNETASLGIPRCGHIASRLGNGDVLIAGGIDPNGEFLDSSAVYHVETGKWSSTGPLLRARGQATAVLMPDGRVLVTGGLTGTAGNPVTPNTAELYNPELGQWETTGSMVQARYEHTMTLLPGGLVMVAGGINVDANQVTYLSTVEVFDTEAGNWMEVAALNTPRAFHTATFLADGRLLVMGGLNADEGYLASTELLEPGTPPHIASSASGLISKIAFVSDRDGNPGIYSVNPDGTGLARLTENEAIDQDPAWSPDGKRIVFASNRNDSSNFDIYVMDSNGSNVERLTTSLADETNPSWSPDGKKIVYVVSEGSQSELDLINIDGTEQVSLTNLAGMAGSPDWSPDGRRIVFQLGSELGRAIFLINADGTGLEQLTDYTDHAQTPAWSPDGQWIALSGNQTGSIDLYLMKADGSDLKIFVQNPGGIEWDPDWSADGQQIVFSLDMNGEQAIYIINADGMGLRSLLETVGNDSNPAWSPYFKEIQPTPTSEETASSTPTYSTEDTPMPTPPTDMEVTPTPTR
jgi:Tol biopolymer transport system component/N-acetylneuraminic acid mutarotase